MVDRIVTYMGASFPFFSVKTACVIVGYYKEMQNSGQVWGVQMANILLL